MHHLAYWKLTKNPFSSASPYFFHGGTVEEAIARTEFLVDSRRSLGVLIGPCGIGKTSFMKYFGTRLLDRRQAQQVRSVYQSASSLTPSLVVHQLVNLFSEVRFSGRHSNTNGEALHEPWQILRDAVVALKLYERRTVLMLDDFVDLDSGWDIVRRLLAFQGPLSILLSIETDRAYELPTDLARQSDLRIDLPAWDLGQTADYFDTAIEHSGGAPGIFDAQAITRIHELSDGVPGSIRRLADLSLVAGAAGRVARISSNTVEDVREELSLHPFRNERELLSRSFV